MRITLARPVSGFWWLFCLLALLALPAQLHAQAASPAGVPPPAGPPAPTDVPPPVFDPAQLAPAGPLAGSGYPPPAGLLAPSTAAPGFGGRPAGVDLDVLYIERTPKYERYAVVYTDGAPHLRSGSEGARRWPAPGETVTFAAHVMNKGTQPAAGFAVAWYIDGQLVKTDAGPELLWPQQETVFELPWAWAHGLVGERLLGAHTVRFVVDPAGAVAETFEANNSLEDRTDALALEVALSPEAYAALDSSPRPGAAFSAEDWLQRHVLAFNAALANSVHPATPQGVGVRVRIDKIRIAWEQPRVDLGYDGGWFIDEDYRAASIFYHAEDDLDWGMLHEWGHQLGLIDTYRYKVAPATVDVLRQDGSRFDAPYDFPGDYLMETVGSLDLGPFNAAGLHSTQGYRRGYYGEYQFDLAPAILLAVTDAGGCPVPGAAVSFYQRDPVRSAAATAGAAAGPAAQPGAEPGAETEGEAGAGRRIDNQPEFSAATGLDGLLTLPNRPAGLAARTATGYLPADNPFGRIEVTGGGNIGLLKVQKDGQEQFAWLTVADLNLDYWLGGRPAVQQVNLVWEGSGAACPPPITPTPDPVGTPGPPAPPGALYSGVAGQDGAADALVLAWQGGDAAEDGFRVEWAAGSGDWALLASLEPGVTEYAVAGLACGLTYRFRVQAFNAAGASPYSSELAYTTPACALTFKKLYLPILARR